MATLVIRNVEDAVHAQLKRQAAAYGRAMEEELRAILREGLEPDSATPEPDLAEAIRALFEPLGGVELPEAMRNAGHFTDCGIPAVNP